MFCELTKCRNNILGPKIVVRLKIVCESIPWWLQAIGSVTSHKLYIWQAFIMHYSVALKYTNTVKLLMHSLRFPSFMKLIKLRKIWEHVCGKIDNTLMTWSLKPYSVMLIIALRLLLKMPTWCSASQLFVQHGAITFLAVIRKQQFSLLRSLCSCNNAITQAFVSCDRFLRSPILANWRNDLYVWLSLCAYFFIFSCSLGLEPVL